MPETRRSTVFFAGTLAAALLLPIAILGWLYLAQTRDGQAARVIRCHPDVASRGAPLLELSAEECRTIGESVDIKPGAIGGAGNVSALDQPTPADIGDAPPPGVPLAPLPQAVTAAHPKLAPYRYYLSQDEIALVEPDARRIVALVEVHIGRPQ